MLAVVTAQFLSAMADNALLFGALALLRFGHYPAWTEPLLQEFFVAGVHHSRAVCRSVRGRVAQGPGDVDCRTD